MTPHWADTFVQELRDRAEQLKRYGNDAGAKICEEHAREIEERRAAYEDETLSLRIAVEESGYSEQNLRMLKKKNQWSGRRRDLPRRPEGLRSTPATTPTAGSVGIPSIAEKILAKQHARATSRRSASR